MATKMLLPDQHQPLHATFGVADCCLCRVERERDECKKKLDTATRLLRQLINKHAEKFWAGDEIDDDICAWLSEAWALVGEGDKG